MFTYLACPYADPREEIRELRAHCASLVAMNFAKNGLSVFSPLSQSAHMKQAYGSNPLVHDEWLHIDIGMLYQADSLSVLELPGWRKSKGVMKEIQLFLKTVHYIRPIPIIGVDIHSKLKIAQKTLD